MPARVELLCHECDVPRAMAATSRALDRVELLEPRDRRDHFDIIATCPVDWDASKVAVGLPQHMTRERRDVLGALLSQHYMQGWGVATWVLHRQPRPDSATIPYRYRSSASGGAFMLFEVDWLPDG